MVPMRIERLSVEVTNRCGKACAFCYSASNPRGATSWTADELVRFASDCAEHGTRAVSFGGGEPLELEGIFGILERLRGVCFRSMTTNGLLLDDGAVARLQSAAIDKVHVSIHFPDRPREVERAISRARALERAGIRSGVNLLVRQSGLVAARAAAEALRQEGIGNDRIVYLPMRGADTPSADEVARVAGGPFQSMSCLVSCGRSPRFCAVSWDKTAAWCSYTTARKRLPTLDHAGLVAALSPLGVTFCGDRKRLEVLDA
jgi:hypothetical protein